MSPPTVLVNTFVQENNKYSIDIISKIFVLIELVFGLNRVTVLGDINVVYVILSRIYTVSIKCIMLSSLFIDLSWFSYFLIFFNVTQYLVSTLLSFCLGKMMRHYYCELNKFDKAAGCRPKIDRGSIGNLVQLAATLVYVIGLFIVPSLIKNYQMDYLRMLPVYFIHALEIHYYGHLLNLLTPRLRLMNCLIESSLAKDKPVVYFKGYVYFKNNNTKHVSCQVKHLMDFYHIIIEAYNFLIEAIKWQLLVTIIVSFISVLGLLYNFSLNVIRGANFYENLVSEIGVILAIMAPLFAPCTFGDRVHNEVRRLRELLASKLYENKLDKMSRNIARSLLAFTETRDLSFTLLRILNIDISLPFKFVGLLVTYLIILLQFEKVLNP